VRASNFRRRFKDNDVARPVNIETQKSIGLPTLILLVYARKSHKYNCAVIMNGKCPPRNFSPIVDIHPENLDASGLLRRNLAALYSCHMRWRALFFFSGRTGCAAVNCSFR